MAAGRNTLDPKLDIVFRMLFGETRNLGLLRSLLNAVLHPPSAIEGLEILRPELDKVAVASKAIALDVRVRLANGQQVDVEMQSQRRAALSERMLYYWARLYSGQLVRGDEYGLLRRSALVWFTDFSMLADERFHSTFQVREAHAGRLLSDQLEIHILELPKLGADPDSRDERSLALWGRFLAATTDAQLEMLAMEDSVLKEAKEALESLSADPRARMLAEQRDMALIMHRHELAWTRHEGKAEGRAEGRAEGKAALLGKLLASRFGPLSDSILARISSASEGELDRWFERALAASSVDEILHG